MLLRVERLPLWEFGQPGRGDELTGWRDFGASCPVGELRTLSCRRNISASTFLVGELPKFTCRQVVLSTRGPAVSYLKGELSWRQRVSVSSSRRRVSLASSPVGERRFGMHTRKSLLCANAIPRWQPPPLACEHKMVNPGTAEMVTGDEKHYLRTKNAKGSKTRTKVYTRYAMISIYNTRRSPNHNSRV